MVDPIVNVELNLTEITEVLAGLEHQESLYRGVVMVDDNRADLIRSLRDRILHEQKQTIRGNRGFFGRLKSGLW